MNHKVKLGNYLSSFANIKNFEHHIPSKYFDIKKYNSVESLYLVDEDVASSIVKHVLPCVKKTNKIVAETNAGLGFISSKLIKKGVSKVRLYEPCSEFQNRLSSLCQKKPNQFELFKRDFFQLSKYSFLDKFDNQGRIWKLLKDVPKKCWKDEPYMTVIGTMPKNNFLHFLIKGLALQTEVISHGRLEIFAIMRPFEYFKLMALPQDNLHTYQWWSVLFQLLLDIEFLDTYPRKAFLPWEANFKISARSHYAKIKDLDKMYFVRICLKRELPVNIAEIPQLLFFVKHFFGRGRNKIIPTIESFVPGVGLHFIVPSMNHNSYFKNLNIFTEIGELTPKEILSLYKELVNHPNYDAKSFAAMIQSEFISTETVENDMIISSEDGVMDNKVI